MRELNDMIKQLFLKRGIQFRKVDPRRGENIVLNINKDCLREQKKILVCYMEYGRTAYGLRYQNTHTNRQEMMQIIKILIDMDFCIDVCGCMHEEAILEMPKDYYDYIFGFGKLFQYAAECNPKAKKIIYMTENPYWVSYEKEQERMAYFAKRHGKKIPMSRTGAFYQKDDEMLADVIVCLGETKYLERTGKPIYRVYPSAFQNEAFSNENANRSTEHFLVFGTNGFVHKGNDILIEVFEKHPEWKLYMCGQDTPQECKKLGISMPENLIDCGYVNVASEEYQSLAKDCRFVLLASCSEGMSTSLLTCMSHGMIPVTLRGTGMDELEDYCEFFTGFEVDQVEETLLKLVSKEKVELVEKSNQIFQFATDQFSLRHYTERMQEIFQQIFD